jgi:hypothetical protein
MQKPILIVLIVCLTAALTDAAFAGGFYQSRYGFGTGNYRAPDPLGLGNNYEYKYKESSPERKRIYTSTGQMMGFINPENGVVFSSQGGIMFRIDRNNRVLDTTNGAQLGKITDEGKLYRNDGLYMGKIE